MRVAFALTCDAATIIPDILTKRDTWPLCKRSSEDAISSSMLQFIPKKKANAFSLQN